MLLLAVNGVSEGFVFATMDKQQVDRFVLLSYIDSLSVTDIKIDAPVH